MTNCLHSPKSPELFQPISLKYGQRSLGCELDTKSVGRPSKGKLLCRLPHCGVEITAGTCTDSDLKLQASIHALQSEACRQQDWHDVPSPPTLEPWSHKLLLLRCTPVSVANKPPVFSLQHTPTNLINFPFRPNAPASTLPPLRALKRPHYFEYSFFLCLNSQTTAIWCQFTAPDPLVGCFKVSRLGILCLAWPVLGFERCRGVQCVEQMLQRNTSSVFHCR